MLSVIICTYNRSRQLLEFLNRFPKVFPAGFFVELVIVDNNSSDKTKDVVAAFCENSPLAIKYVFEEKQGHSHARNRGVKESGYPIVAFTDDDCYPAEDWPAAIMREFSADPTLSLVGGRVELADPEDFRVGVRSFDDRMEITSSGQLLARMIGCNFACRREVFRDIGTFDIRLGKGTSVGCGEDTDFFYRTHKQGLKMLFCPDVVVWHAHGRRTPHAFQSVKDEYASGRGAFYCKHVLSGDWTLMKRVIRELWTLLNASRSMNGTDKPVRRPSREIRALLKGAILRLMGR